MFWELIKADRRLLDEIKKKTEECRAFNDWISAENKRLESEIKALQEKQEMVRP